MLFMLLERTGRTARNPIPHTSPSLLAPSHLHFPHATHGPRTRTLLSLFFQLSHERGAVEEEQAGGRQESPLGVQL